MKIVGIDPGSIITGWGVIESVDMNYGAIAWGHIKPPTKLLGKAGLFKRLKIIHDEIRNVVSQYQPDIVAIEHGFVGRNAHTALVMGETLGAIVTAVQDYQTPYYNTPKIVEYAPKSIKLVVAGSGNATKQTVRYALDMHFDNMKPETIMTEDESDALAVALTCAMKGAADE